ESMHGKKEDTGRTIRFNGAAPLSAIQMGEFSLKPSQGDVSAIFVPLRRLQRDLLQREGMPPRRVNTLLLAKALFPKDKVTLEDLGIKVRPLEDRNALSIESESAVISDTLAEKITSVGGKTQPILSYLANSIRIGETVELEYFYWEPSGSLVTRKAQFKLAAVLPMTGIAVDRNFTPEYPGITQ